MHTQKFIFENGHVYRETTTKDKIALESDLINKLADRHFHIVSNPFSNVHSMAIGKDYLDVVQYLDEVSLNTYFIGNDQPLRFIEEIDPESAPALVRAVFAPRNGAIKIDNKWKPPSYMKIPMVNRFSRDAYGKGYKYHSSMLMSLITDSDGIKELHKCPFPNTYANGQICMGDNFLVSMKDELGEDPSIFEVNDYCMYWFNSTEWNTDLIDERQTSYLLFDSEGEQVHPTLRGYRDVLPIFSASNLSHLAS